MFLPFLIFLLSAALASVITLAVGAFAPRVFETFAAKAKAMLAPIAARFAAYIARLRARRS